jgi:hypothetical protein
MGKKSGSGSGINSPDHISEGLETIFWVKILKFLYADPVLEIFGSAIWDGKNFGSGIEKFPFRDKHPGSATLPGPRRILKKIIMC